MESTVQRRRGLQLINFGLNRLTWLIDGPMDSFIRIVFCRPDDNTDLSKGSAAMNLTQQSKLSNLLLIHDTHPWELEKNGKTSGEK